MGLFNVTCLVIGLDWILSVFERGLCLRKQWGIVLIYVSEKIVNLINDALDMKDEIMNIIPVFIFVACLVYTRDRETQVRVCVCVFVCVSLHVRVCARTQDKWDKTGYIINKCIHPFRICQN